MKRNKQLTKKKSLIINILVVCVFLVNFSVIVLVSRFYFVAMMFRIKSKFKIHIGKKFKKKKFQSFMVFNFNFNQQKFNMNKLNNIK